MATRGRPRKDAQEKGRIKRVPFGSHKLKLQLSDADAKALESAGWTPRWINDTGGRLNQAQAGGYVFVDPKDVTSLGESAIHSMGETGSRVRQVANKGEDVLYTYLMKIRTKHYNEDQSAKWAAIDESELGLIQGRAGGADVSEAYIPDGRSAAVTMR